MKKIYWDSVEIDHTKFFFTVTEAGISFVSSPGKRLSEMFDFYPDIRYQVEFTYDDERTAPYREQFEDYFAGKERHFDLPIDVTNAGTEFQQLVWNEITKIPYGETISYGDLADKVGNRNSVRAVAHAVALNPVLIMIPCHRIVKADGTAGQYRGGEQQKKALLELESRVPKKSFINKLPLPKISQLGRPDL
ncbi:methylated-DNA--[protein]-cysteine S-methyltransferase [Lentilactobacillus sp. SPB1-3]|uniref:Methylated-DNA--[protein]-cysteine S-methyltransferase n=1 Tax=Lentilactobacillus terminaliae TaxID=3003483 RepID=A0ACD5DES2_9LACO|nr:methylated-DNA--[protein]-cysteine S-methyltransferase [Lentilactobacillus sp. SPB1-3]MCZ0977527.1 methylated-DNA--[protein]-cysteine S-methyltransferase [Lentilactobacillus sp. SPB1-3]